MTVKLVAGVAPKRTTVAPERLCRGSSPACRRVRRAARPSRRRAAAGRCTGRRRRSGWVVASRHGDVHRPLSGRGDDRERVVVHDREPRRQGLAEARPGSSSRSEHLPLRTVLPPPPGRSAARPRSRTARRRRSRARTPWVPGCGCPRATGEPRPTRRPRAAARTHSPSSPGTRKLNSHRPKSRSTETSCSTTPSWFQSSRPLRIL